MSTSTKFVTLRRSKVLQRLPYCLKSDRNTLVNMVVISQRRFSGHCDAVRAFTRIPKAAFVAPEAKVPGNSPDQTAEGLSSARRNILCRARNAEHLDRDCGYHLCDQPICLLASFALPLGGDSPKLLPGWPEFISSGAEKPLPILYRHGPNRTDQHSKLGGTLGGGGHTPRDTGTDEPYEVCVGEALVLQWAVRGPDKLTLGTLNICQQHVGLDSGASVFSVGTISGLGEDGYR